MLTVKEVAFITNKAERTIRQWILDGKLKSTKGTKGHQINLLGLMSIIDNVEDDYFKEKIKTLCYTDEVNKINIKYNQSLKKHNYKTTLSQDIVFCKKRQQILDILDPYIEETKYAQATLSTYITIKCVSHWIAIINDLSCHQFPFVLTHDCLEKGKLVIRISDHISPYISLCENEIKYQQGIKKIGLFIDLSDSLDTIKFHQKHKCNRPYISDEIKEHYYKELAYFSNLSCLSNANTNRYKSFLLFLDKYTELALSEKTIQLHQDIYRKFSTVFNIIDFYLAILKPPLLSGAEEVIKQMKEKTVIKYKYMITLLIKIMASIKVKYQTNKQKDLAILDNLNNYKTMLEKQQQTYESSNVLSA